MNRNILFVLCALVVLCAAVKKHPVVLMPGIMGTVLQATGDFPSAVTLPESCPHKFTNQLIWIDVKQTINYECFKNYFASNYNNKTGKWERVEGISFSVPKFGHTYAVDQLAPGALTANLVPYYHKMIQKFEDEGYVDGENIFGAGYDWKELPSDKWINDVKDLIEGAVTKNNGLKAVLVGHSMGGPFSYYFLMKMGDDWIKKYIYMYVPMAPAWMGAVKALDFMLMGVDRDVPIAGKYFAPLMRHIPSLWFLLPWKEAFPGMTLATSPSKTYSFDHMENLLNDGNATDVEGKIADARKLFKPLNLYEKIPPVPVHCFIGRGKNTVISLKFKSDIKPHQPDGVWESASRIMGDGDGTVPIQSLTYVTDKWIKSGKGDVHVYTYDNMGHLPLIKDANVIKKVVSLAMED